MGTYAQLDVIAGAAVTWQAQLSSSSSMQWLLARTVSVTPVVRYPTSMDPWGPTFPSRQAPQLIQPPLHPNWVLTPPGWLHKKQIMWLSTWTQRTVQGTCILQNPARIVQNPVCMAMDFAANWILIAYICKSEDVA